MSRLFIYLGRLSVILAGFACAALGASAFLHLLILGGIRLAGEDLVFAAGGFLFSVPFVALFAGYFAMVPAVVAIALAEVLGLRSWLYFALAGGAAGLVVAWLAGLDAAGEGLPGPASTAAVLCASGIVGGLCYWAVAGRGSGLALDRAIGAPTPPGSRVRERRRGQSTEGRNASGSSSSGSSPANR